MTLHELQLAWDAEAARSSEPMPFARPSYPGLIGGILLTALILILIWGAVPLFS